MRVRRLTNWYPPGDTGCVCVGDVHEIDDAIGAQQFANGDVELAPKAAITPSETPDTHVDTDESHVATTATPGHDPHARAKKKGKGGKSVGPDTHVDTDDDIDPNPDGR